VPWDGPLDVSAEHGRDAGHYSGTYIRLPRRKTVRRLAFSSQDRQVQGEP
jgi:hypothetical protein